MASLSMKSRCFFLLKQFRDLIQRQNFPSNWLSGIVDRKGAFVARIPGDHRTSGDIGERGVS